MKQKIKRKNIFISIIILTLIFFFLFLYFANNKEKITADVVTESDIKIIDVSNPDADTREEVNIPIIMYHHIRSYERENDPIGTNLSVSETSFEQHLNYLKENGYTTVTFDNLNTFPNHALPQKPIILTFDDGYSDNYQAYKMLIDKEMTGVFYIIFNYIGRLDHLNSEQIVEMSKSGMEIGSHTINHLDLTNISEEKLFAELTDSKTKLEEIIQNTVESFCYPAGKYSPRVAELVENAGYKTATTTKSGIASTKDSKFELKRIRANHGDTIKTFINKIES
jgi:peptidoglycan/xylan/chitin deacetylase (PgdA/CDA1 family)